MRRARLVTGFALLAASAAPASSRVLSIGPAAAYHTLAEAAQAAGNGDTIRIAPGEYFECATLLADDLVLEGAGPTTRITDAVCGGKALLVVRGANLTVRDLVLARARSPEMNGAGIRLEAPGLTLERVGFENDQVGVLAGLDGPGAIRVSQCRFEGGGVAGDRPTAALQVGGAALLHVERSTFSEVKGGQVLSGAARTELAGNRIEAGIAPSAAFAVQAAGVLAMHDNTVVLALGFSRDAAVLATGSAAELRGNRLENGTGRTQTLLLDWTQGGAALADNAVAAGDAPVASNGYWRHRASGAVHGMLAAARATAGAARRAMRAALGR